MTGAAGGHSEAPAPTIEQRVADLAGKYQLTPELKEALAQSLKEATAEAARGGTHDGHHEKPPTFELFEKPASRAKWNARMPELHPDFTSLFLDLGMHTMVEPPKSRR